MNGRLKNYDGGEIDIVVNSNVLFIYDSGFARSINIKTMHLMTAQNVVPDISDAKFMTHIMVEHGGYVSIRSTAMYASDLVLII